MSVSRNAFRYRVDLPARIHFGQDSAGIPARSLNLSLSGIGIRLDLPYTPPDQPLIALPSHQMGEPVRVALYDKVNVTPLIRQWTGRISHSKIGCGGGRLGIEFDWPKGRGVRSRSEVEASPVSSGTCPWFMEEPARATYLLPAALAIAGLALDQASKSWVTASAGSWPEGWLDLISGVLAIAPAKNPGAVGSLAEGLPLTGPACAAACLALLGLAIKRSRSASGGPLGRDTAAGLGLLAAGMLGNSADRLLMGHVRDFLVLSAFPNLSFNIADLLILTGAASVLATRPFSRAERDGGTGR